MSTFQYTHPYFNPQRFPNVRNCLTPSLQVNSDWRPGLVRFPPKISNGKLLLARLEGTVDAYDLNNAVQLWQFKLPNPLSSLYPDGFVLVDHESLITRVGDQLFVLDINSGDPLVVKQSPYFDLPSAVFQGADLIAFDVTPEMKRFCVAWNVAEGNISWEFPVDYPAHFITAVDDLVVFASGKSQAACLSVTNGRVNWTVDVDVLFSDKPHESPLQIEGAILSFENLFILGVRPYYIVALEKSTGKVSWIQKLKTEHVVATCGYPDAAIFVLDSRYCYELSANDGTIRREIFIDKQRKEKGFSLFTLPTATDRFLYFSDVHTGTLIAMSLETGEFCWEYLCDAKIPIFNAPVIVGNQLFIVDTKGRFYGFLEP